MPDFYEFHSLSSVQRTDVCALCKEKAGSLIGRVNYAGIGEWDVVQCPSCGLISLDPMPGLDVIKEGGRRLYLTQQATKSRRRMLRYFSRSYRRGGHFALHYLRKLGICDAPSILEVGAGNGYFSQGVKKIYPEAKIYCLDVVEDLLVYYKKHLDCEPVIGEFSSEKFNDKKFDLIIARDILEHVRDPVQMLHDAYKLLKPGGLLFFITPNGREDVWESSQLFKHNGSASLMWQNHFHYFLPETLHKMLSTVGFREEVAFKWDLKRHRKGMGHADMPDLKPEPAPEFGKEQTLEPLSVKWDHEPEEVTSSWLHNLGWLSRIYSAVVDREKKRVDYMDPKGKEFFVISRK